MPTPDLGCRTNSTKINTTTIQGNNNTTPSGMEMLELPFNLSGRLKKASLELTLDLVFCPSTIGRFGDVGRRFSTLCTKPMAAQYLSLSLIVLFAFWGEKVVI
jgi:hypothetical protein